MRGREGVSSGLTTELLVVDAHVQVTTLFLYLDNRGRVWAATLTNYLRWEQLVDMLLHNLIL